MGWALKNLSERRREEIARELIAHGGGQVTRHEPNRGELVGKCPLHEDSNPSFAYNYREKDTWICSSGCGSGDLVELFGRIEGLAQKAALKAFIAKYAPEHRAGQDRPAQAKSGGQAKKKKPKFIPEADFQSLPELPEAWLARLEEARGWSREVMAGLELRFAPQGWRIGDNAKGQPVHLKEDRIAIPIRDDKGRLGNIRLYRPGEKKAKVISWGHGTGSARLWPVEGE